MEGFFKREWQAFLDDMHELGEFFSMEVSFGSKTNEAKEEKADGFFKREWKAFLYDMQCLGEMFIAAFEDDPLLKLCAPKEQNVAEFSGSEKTGFFQNEWQLFKQDIEQADNELASLFGGEKKKITNFDEVIEAKPEYLKDEVDVKLETYLGEVVDELMENACGDKTQHSALREYATYFKPYVQDASMCQAAFKKYYDRHALKMAVSDFPIEQVRIIQNNADIFVKGQEVFGEGGQFIDSRVDTVFERAGISEVNKVIGILNDTITDGKKMQGERIFAEAVSYMVDNGIKVKDGALIKPIKKALEAKLDEVHEQLRKHDDWSEEYRYQNLLAQERKYLYALNRIEQYETEQRISEFESKLNDLDIVV